MEYKIFGCKVNKYYTDKWLNSEKLKGENGIFVSSCVVTDTAKRKWIKFIKDTFKTLDYNSSPLNKGEDAGKADRVINKKMFVSGCGAFKDGRAQEDFFELYPELKEFENRIVILGEDPDEVDIKNGQKVLTVKEKQISKEKIKSISKSLTGLYTKKFILIQGGCDSFCTFCLTVVKRGRHFSRNKEDILQEILDFEKTGGKEVVLTGINLAAWGLDTTNNIGESKLAELLDYLLENSKIPRIRISSMGPEFIDDKCIEVFKNTRIYPHFHISVQSGSSEVLKNMRRHYDGKHLRNVLTKIKNLKRDDKVAVSIGADIIVGFPGETQKDFEESLNLIENYGLTKVHAFPFSPHELGENVPAGKFENQIDSKTKKERMNVIQELAEKKRNEFIEKNKGKKLEVLIEVVGPHLTSPQGEGQKVSFKGWTQNYIEADQDNFEIISGKIAKNEIVIGKLKG